MGKPEKAQNGDKKRAEPRDPMRKDTDMDTPGPADPEKDVVTEGSEESFPASDPPSYMGGGAIAGSPPSRSVETIPPPEPDQDQQKDQQKDQKKDQKKDHMSKD